jgi:hypothetical protein
MNKRMVQGWVWSVLAVAVLSIAAFAQGGAGSGASTATNPADYRPTNTPARPKCPNVRTFIDLSQRLSTIDCNGNIVQIGSLSPGASATFIYAKDYGAVCNGIANDTTAITNAQTAARASKKWLVLPAGTCNVTQISLTDNDHVIGAGMQNTELVGTANNAIVTIPTTAFNASLENLKIKGNTAFASQIGLNLNGSAQHWGFVARNIWIDSTGSHGLYYGDNPFSTVLENIHINNTVGYPVLVDAPIAPGVTLRNFYVHALHASSLKIGYRFKRGRVTCENCNGMDNVPSLQGSRYAVLGKRAYGGGGDTYPDVADTSTGANAAFVNWINTNFEAYEAVGVDHYYFSKSTFDGEIRFAYVNSVAGNNPNRIGLRYEVDETLGIAFAGYIPRGKMNATAVIGQPETDYKNGRFIHANNIPPLELEGVGGAVAPPGFPLGEYWDTGNSKSEPLFRSDSRVVRTTVTSGTNSFNRPSYRYFEVNCTSAPCNLQIPWPGWYRRQETITITDIAGTAGTIPIVITTQAQAKINGQNNLDIRRNRGSVVLMPYESDTVTGVEWRIINEYAGGVPVTSPINGDSNVDFFARWQDTRGKLALSSALFQSGSDVALNGGNLIFVKSGNTVTLTPGTPSGSFSIRLPTALPVSTSCMQMDTSGQISYVACGGGGGGGGSGTVTSVGLSMPSIFSVSPSSITTANTFNVALTSQAANRVLVSPNGTSGVPTFRALVANDLPALPLSKLNITGTPNGSKFVRGDGSYSLIDAANIATGVLGVDRGGTGVSAAGNNAVLIGNGTIWSASTIPNCSNGTTDKLLYNNTTRVFSCGADQTGSGGTGITTLNAQTGSTQSYAKVDDTNVGLTIASSGNVHTFTPTWIGTLAKARMVGTTVHTDQANTWSTGAQSFAAATSLTLPSSAGAAPTTSATIAYDTTNSTLEAGINGVNKTFLFTDGNGSALTALNASNLASGTVPDARFPATLPALNGSALTALSASNLGSGTVPLARLSGITATEMAANAVTNARLAQIATARFKGRAAAGTGDVEDLTGTQATTLLDVFTSSLKGLVPASGGSATTFLNGAGAFTAPAGAIPTLTGTANQILVGGTSGTPQTGALTLTLPGYIEIDTATNPNAASTPSLRISDDGANKARLEILGYSSTPVFQGRRTGGTKASQTATPANELLFSLGGGGHDGTGIVAFSGGLVGIHSDDLWSSTSNSSYITFATTPIGSTAASRAERLRVTSAGNVGIGTSAPSARTHSLAGSNSQSAFLAENTASSTVPAAIFTSPTGVAPIKFTNLTSGSSYTASLQPLGVDATGNVFLHEPVVTVNGLGPTIAGVNPIDVNEAYAFNWTETHKFLRGTTPLAAIQLEMTTRVTDGNSDSHYLEWISKHRSSSVNATGNWRAFADSINNSGTSNLVFRGATDNIGYTTALTLTQLGDVQAGRGFIPAALADGSAPNNSVYFSTTQTKLVYKDASGTVFVLH